MNGFVWELKGYLFKGTYFKYKGDFMNIKQIVGVIIVFAMAFLFALLMVSYTNVDILIIVMIEFLIAYLGGLIVLIKFCD